MDKSRWKNAAERASEAALRPPPASSSFRIPLKVINFNFEYDATPSPAGETERQHNRIKKTVRSDFPFFPEVFGVFYDGLFRQFPRGD